MLLGIDVSYAQGLVKWQDVVKASVIDFAFSKVSEKTSQDPQFKNNWKSIKDSGFIRGGYHFGRPGFDSSISAVDEANFFCSLVKDDLGAYDMLALDIEASKLFGSDFVNWVLAFCEQVEKQTNKKPLIYTGGPFFTDHSRGSSESDLNKLMNYKLWLSAYVNNPKPFIPKPWTKYTIWQKSGDQAPKGSSPFRIAGIKTNVDLNQFEGSIDEFKDMVLSLNLTPGLDAVIDKVFE